MRQQEFSCSDDNLKPLVQECVDLADQHKVFKLKKFGVSYATIQKIVKFKSNPLKQKMRNNIDKQAPVTKQPSKNQDEINQNMSQLFLAMQDQNTKFKLNLQSRADPKKCLAMVGFQVLDQSNKNKLNLFQRFIPDQVSEKFQEFINQAEELLDGEDCEKKEELIQDLTKGVLIKFKDYAWDNPRRFTNYLKCLQLLPLYSDYKRYLGKNVKGIGINFKRQLLQQLIKNKDSFTPGQISSIVTMLQIDPMCNFQSNINLNQNQKNILHQICWKEERVKQYALALNTPQTLKYHVREVTQKMMDSFKASEHIKTGQCQSVIAALTNFDASKFYSIPSIANSRATIVSQVERISNSQGFMKNHYFYQNQINGGQCVYEKKVEFTLKIRKFLKQLKIQSHLYELIQKKLLENKLIQLWSQPISVDNRKKIVQFYRQQDRQCNYRRIMGSIIPLEVQVQAEIEDIFIKLDFKDLSFKDIRQITKRYMEDKILPTRMNPEQQRSFVDQIKKTVISKSYFDNLKLDKELSRANLQQQLIYIFNSLPGVISYADLKLTIEELISQPNIITVHDSPHLTNLQKQYLELQISKNAQFKTYQQIILKLGYKKSNENLYQYLSDKFAPNASVILDYLMKNRKIQFNIEGKIEPSSPQTKTLDTILANKQDQIKNMQQTEYYYKFNQAYDFLLREQKKELQQKVGVLIKQIFYENNRNEPDLKSLSDNNFNLDLLPEDLKSLIIIRPIYKEYNNLLQSLKKNQPLKNQCELQKYISSTVRLSHPLRKYTPQQRDNVITGLIKEGLQFLNNDQSISGVDKREISNIIVNSDQWLKLYPKKQQEIIPEQPEEQRGNKSPKKIQKRKSAEQFKQDFVGQLRRRCNFPADINDDLIKANIKNNLLDNPKEFVKSTGVKGLMIINKLQAAIINEKQFFKVLLDQIFEAISNQAERTQRIPTSQKKQKVQQKIETNPINPEIDEPYENIIQIFTNCPAIPANIPKQKFIQALAQKPYDDPKKFLRAIGVGLMKVKDAVAFMEERRSDIEPVLNKLIN